MEMIRIHPSENGWRSLKFKWEFDRPRTIPVPIQTGSY